MAWRVEYPQIWFTVGPQCKDAKTIEGLLRAGATGARLAFSYGTHQTQIERNRLLRNIAASLGRSILLIADLQGEKCRLARFMDSHDRQVDKVAVYATRPFTITKHLEDASVSADKLVLPVQVSTFIDNLDVGDTIVYGDGELLLTVLKKHPEMVTCSVNRDGFVNPGRGFVVRSSTFRPASITLKDQHDLEFICSSGAFDAVALSFVASVSDVEYARTIMKASGCMLPIIAKIETEIGIHNIDEVAKASDGVMAARGDLALTTPWEELPAFMNEIARAARSHKTPWILATQLVSGLEQFEFPTRPEICDLAQWMSQDALGAMLSYETAFGPRPIEAVEAVNKIISRYKRSSPPIWKH